MTEGEEEEEEEEAAVASMGYNEFKPVVNRKLVIRKQCGHIGYLVAKFGYLGR